MRTLILAAALGALVFAQHSDNTISTKNASLDGYRTILEFDVMAPDDAFSRTLQDGLKLRVERDRMTGASHTGWSVYVTRGHTGDNLLYGMRNLHGPHPSHLLAWHFAGAEHYYDSTRILPVYGYPLELRLECQRCRVTPDHVQSPPDVVFRNEFTAGTVRIGVRRLASANPSQIR